MNPLHPPEKDLNLHILLEQTETGRSIAAIAEISGCQVEAATREEALIALQQLLKYRLTKMEIVPLSLSLKSPARENPWTEFIGIFEGDAEFAELAEELRAEREIDVSDAA
jgi:predicted RNase H-like HicB family nuclease